MESKTNLELITSGMFSSCQFVFLVCHHGRDATSFHAPQKCWITYNYLTKRKKCNYWT